MDRSQQYEEVKKRLERRGIDCREQEPMDRHSTMRVGGPADLFVTVRTGAELAGAVGIAHQHLAGAQAAEEPLGVPAGDVGTAGDGENHGESPRKKRADSTAVRPLCHAAAPVCGSGEAEGSAGTAELPLVWLVMV